ncbi:unnamed protein product, partial [marine sediment metagenome]
PTPYGLTVQRQIFKPAKRHPFQVVRSIQQ